MDLEPIYCAEQIVVPTNLADVLKAYAKEVIRRQPEDLLEFSAIYFANLANISQEVEELVPPSHDQLQVVFTSLNLGEESDNEKVPMHKLVNLCSQAGIAWATLKAAQETGNFGQDGDVSKKEFLAMLLIMSSDNLPAVMSGLFEVFGEGGKLELQDFMQLLRYLKTWDNQITDELFDEVHNELQGSAYLTFASLVDCPPLKEHLAAV